MNIHRTCRAVAIGACLGSIDRFEGASADLAETYAGRDEDDFRLVQGAVRDGRVDMRTGL